MADTKAGGYISKLTFNNGEELEISKNDIVVFVGPNNAGKSQSLKDIYNLSSSKQPSIVVSDISVTKYTMPISPVLEKNFQSERLWQSQSLSIFVNQHEFFR